MTEVADAAAARPTSAAVTVIGLGAMGAACARALISGGHDVTVWNRSPERAAPFADLGARVASTAAEAVAASPVSLVIVASDDAVRETLASPIAEGTLRERAIVNLTADTPDSAVELQRSLAEHGAGFLSGRVGCYPRAIGTSRSSIIYAGDPAVFDMWSPVLTSLGSDLRYVGADVRTANVLAFSMFNLFMHSVLVGFYEAAAFADRSGVPLSECVPVASKILVTTMDAIERGAEQSAVGARDPIEATIETHGDAVARGRRVLVESGAEHELFDAVSSYVERARGAGLDGEEISALFELLRTPRP